MADIRSMFYQVRVSKSDIDFLRFLWWRDGDIEQDPVDHRMLVVVISRKKDADTGSLLTHFICLALGLSSMKQMERNCIISRVERLLAEYLNMLPGVSVIFCVGRSIVSGRRGLHDA